MRSRVNSAKLFPEMRATFDQFHDMFHGDYIVQAPSCQVQQVPLVPHPAGMGGQVSQGDGRAEIRDFRNILPDGIIQLEFAFRR